MSVTFEDLPRLMGRTLSDPAGVAKTLTAETFPAGVIGLALTLVAVLSSLVVEVTFMMAGLVPPEGPAALSPLAFAGLVALVLSVLALALSWTGRMFGGRGTFAATLVVLIWLQLMAVVLQVVQALFLMTIPGLLGVVTIVGGGLMLFFVVNFIDVVQGFGSLWKALATIVIGIVGMAFGLGLILSLIGVSVGVAGGGV